MNHHPRILVAGCGYTGARCADLFFAGGARVTGLVSSAESRDRLSGKPYPIVAADAADPADLARALGAAETPADILIHCLSGKSGREAAAYRRTYVKTLRRLIDAAAPSFCVFTSSTSVYTQDDGGLVDEDSAIGGTPTGDVLIEAERIALGAGGAAVRLGGIYGPGRGRFVAAARAGEPLPGDEDTCINLIHVEDAAAALFHVALHRLTGAFNAVDDHPVRRADLAAAIRDGSSELPMRTEAPRAGKRVANARLRATGWTPRYPSVLDAVEAGAV